MARYAVAARRVRVADRPLPPWHAVGLLDDDPTEHAGELAVSLCGVPGLQVFPLDWEGLIASNGCPVCRVRVR
jgi:hypothetical protein